MKRSFRLALVQLLVGNDKALNVSRALDFVSTAASSGANLVVLPECFNSPYGALQTLAGVQSYAEPFDSIELSPSLRQISSLADRESVTIVAGSIPTEEDGRFFNTSCTFGPDGALLATHRKLHLFDIDIPGEIQYRESAHLTAGSSPTVFEIPDIHSSPENPFSMTAGIGICFDIRFAELAQYYQRQGCSILLYPGAFNMVTGPAHWELLCRARAVDNQLFVAVCSPARVDDADYVAFGNSMCADPWGEILCQADGGEECIVYCDVDLERIDQVRQQLPVVSGKGTYRVEIVDDE